MKTKSIFARRRNAAFTLIELLTVIAIIAILAAMLLPAISKAITSARKTRARVEEQALANAIENYNSAYGRFPVSTNVQAYASTYGVDFTYGANLNNSPTPIVGTQINSGVITTNSEVIAILMDMTAYPNGVPTVDANHVKNPKNTIFLNAPLSGYTPTPGTTPLPGVDNAGVYRDPWGNPYIITMDLNYDNFCSDSFYSLASVSQVGSGSQTGFNGLFNTNSANANSDAFWFHGPVMVWSAGPDGQVSNANGISANAGVNKDNVVSWK